MRPDEQPAPEEERKDYSTVQRVMMAKKGWAIPIRDQKGDIVGGAYPIADTADLQDAIQAYGRAKNPAEVKAHIIKRARALGATAMLPDAWKTSQHTEDGGISDAVAGGAWSDVITAIEGSRRSLADAGMALYMSVPPAEVRGLSGGTGDGSYTMHGSAAVFDTPTVLFENTRIRISEELAPGSFTQVLADPALLVHLNLGHDMNRSVASTDVAANEIGGLELRQDSARLGYFARTDRDDPDAQAMAVKMRRGVLRGASFKFHIDDEQRSETDLGDGKRGVHYRVTNVGRLSDVCVCAQGAYRAATSHVRSYAMMAVMLDRRSDEDSLGNPRRSLSVGVSGSAPEVGVGGSDQTAQVAAMRAKVRLAATKLR